MIAVGTPGSGQRPPKTPRTPRSANPGPGTIVLAALLVIAACGVLGFIGQYWLMP